MRRLFYIFALCFPTICLAQEEAPRPTIPSSPAFSILSFEPAAVLRPTTPKSLAADLVNAFDKDGKLVVNLGMEVMPYWLRSRPLLQRDEYLHPSFTQLLKQSLSLSAATVRDSAKGATKLGAGFRFKLLNGEPVQLLDPTERKLIDQETVTSALAAIRAGIRNGMLQTVEQCIEQFVTNISATAPKEEVRRLRLLAREVAKGYESNEAELFIEQLTLRQVASYDSLASQVAALNYLRRSWIAELAGATAFNTSADNEVERIGVWGTLSNYVSTQDLFSLTTRYMWHNSGDTTISNFDAGLSFMKQTQEYNVSIEAMARWYLTEMPDLNSTGNPIRKAERGFSYRVALQASYILTKDLSVNLSIGKGFDDAFARASGFFSIFGFNYSIFRKELVSK
jgi:hypothetical protein